MTKISVSILNCDFNNIDNEIRRINNSSADYIHIDIMDGYFVKNNTSELFNMKKISSLSKKKLDIHLMVQKPNEIIDLYCLPTTEIISIHYESECNFNKTFNKLKDKNIKCGLAINPDTKISSIKPLLKLVDLVLVMSVYPGKGGQIFINKTFNKISELKKITNRKNHSIKISVDGGVDDTNSKNLINMGCDILVSGTYLIKSENIEKSIKSMLKR